MCSWRFKQLNLAVSFFVSSIGNYILAPEYTTTLTKVLKSKPQLEHFLVIEDNLGQRNVTLEAATYSIGRDLSNSIVLHSQLVSRQHAILLRVTIPKTTTHLFRIIDGNLQGNRSKNGLLINGERCFSHNLKHGDVITFGDVTAKYYGNLPHVNNLASDDEEAVTSLLSYPNQSSQTLIAFTPFYEKFSGDTEQVNSSEAAIVRLASYPELIPSPILEINMAGNITYLNPAAVREFPKIRQIKLQHPILAGIISEVENSQQKIFIREVEVDEKVYEQSVQYIPESDLIRSYIVDITKRKQAEAALRDSEAKYRALLNAIPDLMVVIKKDGSSLDYAPAKDLDWSVADTDLLNNNLLPLEIAQQQMHYIEKAIQTGEPQIFEYQLSANGSFQEKEARIVVSGQNEVLAIVRDITERKQVQVLLQQTNDELEVRVKKRTIELTKVNDKLRDEIVERRRAEEAIRFLQTMTQSISEASDFHSALGVALLKVCNFTGWKFAEAWIPSADGQVLESSPAWYGETQNLEEIRKINKTLSFQPNQSFPGRVWSLKEPVWIQDISTPINNSCPRQQLLIASGFKAGLGIPIIEQNKVLAVLIFFMDKYCEEDKHRVEVVSTVATQLGSLIQRKWVEEALRHSEERFRLFVEGVKDYAIFMLDVDAHIISWNSGAERISGYKTEEILGKHFSCFYSKVDIVKGKPETSLNICQLKGQIEEEGWRIRHDGSRIWAHVVITALRDENGNLRGFSQMTRDITERKRAEIALRSSVATNRALLNAIPDSMFRINQEGIFVNFKAAKDKQLPLPKKEFLGKHLHEVFPLEVAQPMMECVKRALQTRDIQIFEYQLLLNEHLLDYEARIVVSVENEVIAIIRDITKRKQVEAEIRKSLEQEKELNELKSRFVTMASHEFRTPLATILSSSELLESYSHIWSEEKKFKHFQRIRICVQHMTTLMNDVLLIGKAEAGKLELELKPLDIFQFCRELVEDLQLTSNSHTISFQDQGNYSVVKLDEKVLRQILTNLLSNAIKYSPNGGNIYFDVNCEPEKVIFRVQDPGIGIPVADQAKLFISFHRASNVGMISGTGLGLAIVKKSVDLHGGTITVESEVGVGTTFIVSLPIKQKDACQD